MIRLENTIEEVPISNPERRNDLKNKRMSTNLNYNDDRRGNPEERRGRKRPK